METSNEDEEEINVPSDPNAMAASGIVMKQLKKIDRDLNQDEESTMDERSKFVGQCLRFMEVITVKKTQVSHIHEGHKTPSSPA